MSNGTRPPRNSPAPVDSRSAPTIPTAAAGDQIIKCADFGKRPQCTQSFIFTVGEQEYYAHPDRGYPPPRRCKPCRDAKKVERGDAPRSYAGNNTGNTSNTANAGGNDYKNVWDDRSGGGGGRPSGGRNRRSRDDSDY